MGDTVWVVFRRLELSQKLIFLNPFTDAIFRFQSICHYNWRGQHIYQRGDIPSWTTSIFGLGHNMGRFAPFVLGSTQRIHLLKIIQKSINDDVMYLTLRRVYRELMDQGRKWRLLVHLKQGWKSMRGQNLLASIITTKQTKLSLRGKLHRKSGTLISQF